MSMPLSKAKRHFEAALSSTKVNDAQAINLIQGLIELTKALEEMDQRLEQIDSSTR